VYRGSVDIPLGVCFVVSFDVSVVAMLFVVGGEAGVPAIRPKTSGAQNQTATANSNASTTALPGDFFRSRFSFATNFVLTATFPA
jgi:hypothetical protein